MSEVERLLFRIVLGDWAVDDPEYGVSCFHCYAREKYVGLEPIMKHKTTCAYKAARDYLASRGFVDKDGKPLVDIQAEVIDA